ncbi:hypothetical protein [Streptomyces cylindrosporus]|uniref:hypothetical protein n=1 Tax=Streptomyces cylindrosporus TaxID=2927583 RepID=UPI003557512D
MARQEERPSSTTFPGPLRNAASALHRVPGAGMVSRVAEGALDKVGAVSPRGRRLAVYAGAGVLGVAGIVEWPVAVTGAAVAWLTQPRPEHPQELEGGIPAGAGMGTPVGADPTTTVAVPPTIGGEPPTVGGEPTPHGSEPVAPGGASEDRDGDSAPHGSAPMTDGGETAAAGGEPAAHGGGSGDHGSGPAAVGAEPLTSGGDASGPGEAAVPPGPAAPEPGAPGPDEDAAQRGGSSAEPTGD